MRKEKIVSDLELAKTSLAEVMEGFSNLTEHESQELRELCERLVQLRDLEELAADTLKSIKAAHRKYARELVPDAMDELGMQSLTTANGVDITINDDLHVQATTYSVKKQSTMARYGRLCVKCVTRVFRYPQKRLEFTKDVLQKSHLTRETRLWLKKLKLFKKQKKLPQ
jgi:biotin-(acetyl-CoA carboxylase) ligase